MLGVAMGRALDLELALAKVSFIKNTSLFCLI